MPLLNGGVGNDALGGDATADTLSGGLGADTLNGGAGDDVLYGHSASDVAPDSGRIDVHQIQVPLDTPVFATSAPGDPNRLYVVEVTGQVQIINLATEQKAAAPFLDIPSGEIGSGGERGLLGLAFSPDYATSGKFYVSLAAPTGEFQIYEYTRSATNPDQADLASRKLVLSVPHPENQHYAGWMSFGPDGMLFIATGDGHAGQVASNPAQDPNSLLGKILRIDVRSDGFPGDPGRNYAIPNDNPFVGKDGADEVYAMGLRNPWRASFDPNTGDLYIADVGENLREEIDIIPAGSGGGQNFGWAAKEGDLGPDDPRYADPALEYAHGNGPYEGNSVTGGYVYDGPGGAQGLYVFGDFIKPNVWMARFEGGAAQSVVNVNEALTYDTAARIGLLTSFGVDGEGRLYAMTVDGKLFRLTPSTAAGDGGDVLNGGDGSDRLYGGFGADSLTDGAGGAWTDTLSGGIGADTLATTGGADQLSGGAGADVFKIVSVPGEAGHVTDFQLNVDKLDLSTLVKGSGYAGSDPVADGYVRFVGVSGGTQVVFDGDGNGSSAGVVVTTLDGVTGSGFTSSQMLTPDSQTGRATIGLSTRTLSVPEGSGGGATAFVFTVTRGGYTGGTDTVDWSVRTVSAPTVDGADFAGGALPTGSLTFAPGETSKTITVNVAADGAVEGDESFLLQISRRNEDVYLSTTSASGKILNDDGGTGGVVINSPGPGSTLNGGAGNDTINASQGPDLITTGGGADVIAWAREPWAPAKVTDFAVGSDKLDLSALFQTAGYTGSDPVADHYITLIAVEGGTGVLFDRDGAAAGQQWGNYIINLQGVSPSQVTWAQLSGGSTPPPPPPPGDGQVYTSPGPGSTVTGGAGDDTINASQGSDVLTGGAGADVFHWDKEPWSPATVTDFQLGTDRIDFSALFSTYGYAGSDPVADRWITFLDDGAGGTKVLFDHDGAGGSPQWPNYVLRLEHVSSQGLTWAQLAGDGANPPPPPPPGGQVITSDGPGDTLTGGAGNDTLVASRGSDVLTGAGGADHFVWNQEPWSPAEVTDFTPGTDKLDLRGLLDASGYAGTDPFGAGYLKLIEDGAGGTKVLFDRDAGGPDPVWPNYIIHVQNVAPGQIGPGDWIFQ